MEVTHVKQHESVIKKINSKAKKVKEPESVISAQDAIKKYKDVQRVVQKGNKVDKYA